MREHIKWTGYLLARLGYLLGQGMTAREIAADPEFNTNCDVILRQALRHSLPASKERATRVLTIRLPPEAWDAFETIAKKRGLPTEQLMRQVLCICGAEPVLIENVTN